MKKFLFLSSVLFLFWSCNNPTKTIEEIADEIHQNVLTVDTHTDTPWALLSGDFDLSERHDYKKDRSRVDFPRMKEGGLDAVFMASFVGQSDRDEKGFESAFHKAMIQIDSIHSHLSSRTTIAEIAYTPNDAYRFEKEGKRKLEEKNLDIIAINDITRKDSGFGSDNSLMTLLDRRGELEKLPLMSKEETADLIWDRIVALR